MEHADREKWATGVARGLEGLASSQFSVCASHHARTIECIAMNTLKFPCPSCGRQLELPSEAHGRLAQCPACLGTFVTGESEAALPSLEPVSDSIPSDPRHSEEASVFHPFASPLQSQVEMPLTMNPYQPSYQSEPVAVLGDVEIVSRSFEDCFSPTLSIFGDRLGQLVLAFLMAIAVGFVGCFGWFAAVMIVGQAVGDRAAAVAFVVTLPFPLLLSSYLTVGLVRNAIAVARNEPSPIAEMLPPLHIVMRFVVGAVIASVFLGAVVGVVLALLTILMRVAGIPGIPASLLAIGVLGGSGVSMIAYWFLWPWVFLISDGKATAWGALRLAYTLTMHNKATSILLVVIALVLSIAGASACYIGLIITQPLTNLMFAVAYLLMTNQIIQTRQQPKAAWQADLLNQ